MKRTGTRLSALLLGSALFLSSCTINENNGDPAKGGTPDDGNAGMVPKIVVSADSAWVKPGDTLIITVSVKRDTTAGLDTLPYASATVTATTSGGTLAAPSVRTNADGLAVFRFTDTVESNRSILFKVGSAEKSFALKVTDTPDQIQSAVTARAERSNIPADDSSFTWITVSVIDENHNPISNEIVQFWTTAGTIKGEDQPSGPRSSGQSLTNENGVARAKLISTPINDTAFVTVFLLSDETKTDQTQVAFTGVGIKATLDSSNLRAGSTTGGTIELTNGAGKPLVRTPIYYSLGKGASSNLTLTIIDSLTDYDGRSRFTITGDNTGSDSLIVNAAGAHASYRINVTNLNLRLTLESSVLQASKDLYTLLYADFTDLSGTALKSKSVTVIRHYTTVAGADTTDTLSGSTDNAGRAEFQINAVDYEADMRLEVVAKNTSTDIATADANLKLIKTRRMSIIALPNQIAADGSSTSQILVQIKNENNNPIVGDSIKFSTNAGLIPARANTDELGRATVSLTSDRRNTVATVVATLARDISQSDTVQVIFNGVTLDAAVSPKSITANGIDSAILVIKLADAAKNPITGERVSFFKTNTTTIIIPIDTVTDNRGEARAIVKGTGTGSDTITVKAAGAEGQGVIFYSTNTLTIDTVAGSYDRAVADDTGSVTFIATYKSGANVAIAGATIDVAATMGDMGDVFALSGTTNASGQFTFSVNNPNFASTGTIDALATKSGTTTAGTMQLYYRAIAVHRIQLNGSPSVISISGDRALITAVAFDEKGNRVSNAHIAFNMLDGPGGGEYISPASVTTGLDGSATTYLISGSIPSEYNEVKIVAGDFNAASDTISIKSDTVSFTIAGPPHNITIRRNISKIVKYPSTYGKQLAAIVSDVNNNPVADGTEVTFSAQITGYMTYIKTVDFSTTPFTYAEVPDEIFPFEDLNNNFIADAGEDRFDSYKLGWVGRGEDRNGDGKFQPGPKFYDINWDGRRQFRFHPNDFMAYVLANGVVNASNYPGYYDYPEPLNGIEPIDLITLDTTTSTYYFRQPKKEEFGDFNRNGEWDYWEGCEIDAYSSDAAYTDVSKGWDATLGFRNPATGLPYGEYVDIDWNQNGYPEPASALTIKKTITTVGGVANNEVIYGQSDGNHLQIMINAESKGLVAPVPEEFVVQIAEDDAPYWSPKE